jgi:serine/threonine protein kinase
MEPPAGTIDESMSESSSSDRQLGRDLGEYRLLKRLGRGGMGHVYRAMHRRLEKLVAVKLLPGYRAANPRELARFDREIKAVGRLNHPHVVQAYDAEEIDGTRFLVMEYVDGLDLSLLVRYCGALRIDDACELTRQAALGLQAAHDHGLIHRDIKPSNLMLGRNGILKVLDLGLARFRSEPLEAGEMTAINETIGTAEYIAPEQVADSHRVDIRADIYSLGCTFFRLLTGQPPFFGPKYRTAVEKMVAHLKEDAPSIRDRRAEVSESLAGVIERMMAKDPDHRFRTPQDVADALAPFAAQCDLLELIRQADREIQDRDSSASSASSSRSSTPGGSSAAESAGNFVRESLPATGQETASPSELAQGPGGRVPARWWAVAAAILGVVLTVAGIAGSRLGMFGRGQALFPPAALPPAPAPGSGALPPGEWVDVLPQADLDRDRVSDLWERRGDGVGCHGTSGYPRLMLPVTLAGDYDLEVEFTRNFGRGPIVIVVPLGDKNAIDYILSGSLGGVHGFNSYDGHDLQDSRNPSAHRPGTLLNGKRYTVSFQIRGAADPAVIHVSLDGETLVHCTAPASAFQPPEQSGCAEPNRPTLGVSAGVDATFHCARVRIASGKGAFKGHRRTEPCPPAQWTDLLSRIDLRRDALRGGIRRDGNDLVFTDELPETVLMLPAAVRGSYELQVEFSHSPTNAILSFVLPVGLRRVRVNPNHPGSLLAYPSWMDQPQEGSGGKPPGVLEEGKTYRMAIKVTAEPEAAAIDICVDDQPWMSWSGKPTDLHDGPIVLPELDRIGLVAAGTLVVKSARLRLESGKALLLTAE